MGWSDIVHGAGFEEPDLRAAVVEFVTGLDLRDVTLAGESLGGALALHASVDLKDRISRVVAFNSYAGGARTCRGPARRGPADHAAGHRTLLRPGTAERGGQDSAAIELIMRHLPDS